MVGSSVSCAVRRTRQQSTFKAEEDKLSKMNENGVSVMMIVTLPGLHLMLERTGAFLTFQQPFECQL